MAIIVAEKINKTFVKKEHNWRNFFDPKITEKVAVNNLDLRIEEGEFVAFLGPNGAGKTTFLKILSGIIHPTSGKAKVMGHTPWERSYNYLRQIAIVMGNKNQLWWDLPAIDSYKMLKEVYEIPTKKFKDNLEMMVETLDMKELLIKRLRNMSLGERMKCELVASFLHSPKVMFLDEPTIGLDVVSSQSIRKFLEKINREKKCTMILTSHYMGDIEALCKRVVIINHGMKIYDGELSKLKDKYAPEKKIEIFLADLKDREIFAKLKVEKRLVEGKGIVMAKKGQLGEVAKQVFDKFDIEKVSITDPDTEDVITKIFKSEPELINIDE